MEITAVIPVRAGSVRVKNKNIRPFADSSLLEIKINQLKEIGEIDNIVVSSDSDEMLALAEKMRVKPRRRPKEYCDEKSKSFNDVVEYIAQNQVNSEVMMWVPCVCPLLSDSKILEGISTFKKMLLGEITGDSVVTAKSIKEYIFGERGPVNFEIEHHVPSQQLPNWHVITNGFFIARRKDMIRWKFVYGKNPVLCEVNKLEAIDIDDEIDFRIAEFFIKNREDRSF